MSTEDLKGDAWHWQVFFNVSLAAHPAEVRASGISKPNLACMAGEEHSRAKHGGQL